MIKLLGLFLLVIQLYSATILHDRDRTMFFLFIACDYIYMYCNFVRIERSIGFIRMVVDC